MPGRWWPAARRVPCRRSRHVTPDGRRDQADLHRHETRGPSAACRTRRAARPVRVPPISTRGRFPGSRLTTAFPVLYGGPADGSEGLWVGWPCWDGGCPRCLWGRRGRVGVAAENGRRRPTPRLGGRATFSWFGRNRRLAEGFENLAETFAAFVTAVVGVHGATSSMSTASEDAAARERARPRRPRHRARSPARHCPLRPPGTACLTRADGISSTPEPPRPTVEPVRELEDVVTTIRLLDPAAATGRVREIFDAVLTRERKVFGATTVSNI